MKTIPSKLIALYDSVVSNLQWPQSLLIFFLRFFWGMDFIQTGWGKLHSLDKVTEFFASLGIPFPGINAVIVGSVELTGGALLLVGLLSRFAALTLSGTLVVAYITADWPAVKSLFTSDYAKFFAADPWPFLLVCLIVLLFGPGQISIDSILKKRRK